MVRKPTITWIIRLNRLCWFGHVQYREWKKIGLIKNVIYKFGNNKAER
jgi:hypothetical protein